MNGRSIRVRDYTEADRRACLSVFDSNVPQFFSATEREQFESFLVDPPGPYLVLHDEAGRVVACGRWARDPGSDTADLCWGMVLRSEHGRGLGRLLTGARIVRIRAHSPVRTVALGTTRLTRDFYRRLGFMVERVVSGGYGSGRDRCEMELDLPSAAEIPGGRSLDRGP